MVAHAMRLSNGRAMRAVAESGRVFWAVGPCGAAKKRRVVVQMAGGWHGARPAGYGPPESDVINVLPDLVRRARLGARCEFAGLWVGAPALVLRKEAAGFGP